MTIIEKIKQFFRNIGNKPKMIEEPKDSHIKVIIKDELKERIAVDPKSCLEENLVPNILKTLGVREEIRNNPRFMAEFEVILKEILKRKGIDIPEKYEQVPGERVDAIIEAIKSSPALSEKQVYEKYSEEIAPDDISYYEGIEIEPITGNVFLQGVAIGGANKKEYNEMVTQKFSCDEKNNMKKNKERFFMGEVIPRTTYKGEITYNSDGIEMEEISSLYDKNGEECYRRYAKRDEKHPAIMQVINGDKVEYQAIEPRDMSKLDGPKIGKDKQGKSTLFTFKNYEEVEKYCEEYREEIYNELGEKPKGYPKDSKLEKALNVATNKLAIIVALEDRPDNEQEKE